MRIIKHNCFFTFCFLLLACYSLLSGCASVSVEQQKESEYYYKVGLTYLNENKFQMAFVQFQKALQLDPDNKRAMNSLGLVYYQLEDYEKAKDLFISAVYIDPNFSDAYTNMGITYMKTAQWREALESFKKALSNPLYQNPERAFYNRGVCYYRAGQYDLAVNEFKDAIRRAPSYALPYYGLALAYNKAGKYGDASAVVARAIEIDPAYKGDRTKFQEDMKHKAMSIRGEEEADFRDYMDIMRY